jgi:hypothetical protein
MIGRTVAVGLGIAWFGLALASEPARAQSVTLYELTESMTVVGKAPNQQRVATAQLMGFARPGTPLCSAEIATSRAAVAALHDPAARCTINATGSDIVSLRTGRGTLHGRLAVVIQGDNPVDGPELVVTTGQFRGEMDFSPAILGQLPFGLAEGTVTLDGGRVLPFRATFRLPFDGDQLVGGFPLRELLCPGSSPNPRLWGRDIKYVATEAGVPTGQCIDVTPGELVLRYPAVRFDIDLP